MENLILARGLTKQELNDILELERACCRYESLCMKLNQEMLECRPDKENNDFLLYDGSRLIGFLGLYDIAQNGKEIEMTGMVHPDYRLRGIFGRLFAAARQVCMDRKAEKLLLIAERNSVAGIGFCRSTGARYAFSEYRLRFDEAVVPDFRKNGITLRKAGQADYPELMRFDAEAFGIPEEDIGSEFANKVYESTYVIELEGCGIGKIGIGLEGENGYIFGFFIKPEYRGRGYGREALSLALLKLKSDLVKTVLLEVSVENENALSLYKACGFKEVTVYDYYEMLLHQ